MVALSLLPKPIVTIALWSCIALSDDSIRLAECHFIWTENNSKTPRFVSQSKTYLDYISSNRSIQCAGDSDRLVGGPPLVSARIYTDLRRNFELTISPEPAISHTKIINLPKYMKKTPIYHLISSPNLSIVRDNWIYFALISLPPSPLEGFARKSEHPIISAISTSGLEYYQITSTGISIDSKERKRKFCGFVASLETCMIDQHYFPSHCLKFKPMLPNANNKQ